VLLPGQFGDPGGGPVTPDQVTRRTTAWVVAAVALFAGVTSYSHIYDLARAHGQAGVAAVLLPLSVDGLIGSASLVMLAASRAGGKAPGRARFLLGLGIGATVAANVAYGLPSGIVGAVVSAWPAVSFIGSVELLTWLRAHVATETSASGTASGPILDRALGRDHRDASGRAPGRQTDPGRKRRQGSENRPVFLTTVETAFADTMAGHAAVPSLRQIQGALRVGQGKAQQAQAHLRTLQAAEMT
jgi:Protein of unknown function (DUF2637)